MARIIPAPFSGITLDVDPEADPHWTFLDAKGHGHFAQQAGDSNHYVYPTLAWHPEPCTMGHGDDCTSEGKYRCVLCGEIIVPGMRSSRPTVIHGRARYTLDVIHNGMHSRYVFDEPTWMQVEQEVRSIITTILDPFCVLMEQTG